MWQIFTLLLAAWASPSKTETPNNSIVIFMVLLFVVLVFSFETKNLLTTKAVNVHQKRDCETTDSEKMMAMYAVRMQYCMVAALDNEGRAIAYHMRKEA